MSKKDKTGLNADVSWDSIKALFSKKPKTVTDEEGHLLNSDDSPTEFIATLPTVNLLPSAVREGYAAKDLTNKFLKIGLGVVLLFVLVFVGTIVSGMVYKKQIESIKADTQKYQTEITSLAPVSSYLSAINTKRTDLYSKVSSQVDTAKVASEFTDAANSSGYNVSTLSLGINIPTSDSDTASSNTASSNGNSACANPSPWGTESGIGCINFELKPKSGNDADIDKLFKILDKNPGFVNLYTPNKSQSDQKSVVSGSVAIQDKFYTQRYLDLQNDNDGNAEKTTDVPSDTNTSEGN